MTARRTIRTAQVVTPAPMPTMEQLVAIRAKRAEYSAYDLVRGAQRRAQTAAELVAKIAAGQVAYELGWSGTAFATAAQAYVEEHLARIAVGCFTQAIEAGKDETEARVAGLQAAAQVALEEALRGAENPERSTSPVSNVMASEKTAAYASYARKAQITVEVL